MRNLYTILLLISPAVVSSFHVNKSSFKVIMFTNKDTNFLASIAGGTNLLISRGEARPAAANSVSAEDDKVSITSQSNSLEITPLSSLISGVLIESINRTQNKGISTSFFIKDTSSWFFYTNSTVRLTINGNGSISTSEPLLVNNAVPDDVSSLRVNGIARVDSSLFIRASSDTGSFISLHRNISSVDGSIDDGISPYTTTPTAWANGENIPAFRLRHPGNVSNSIWNNESLKRDFLIVPYIAGMAIEYNGVVECWVGEWSIHKGVYYGDVEGKGNGWGAVFWVGDDVDRGGVRATARNNTELGGNVAYGELSVEKFQGSPNGDFRFRLPSTQNEFHFVYGERGSENVIAKLHNEGLIIPKISTVTIAQAPEKAQLVFDSTTATFKGYNGTEWIDLSSEKMLTGAYSLSGDGADNIFLIPHGLTTTPTYYNVIATSGGAGNFSYVTANNTYLIVHYNTAPPAGTSNLSWNWQVKR